MIGKELILLCSQKLDHQIKRLTESTELPPVRTYTPVYSDGKSDNHSGTAYIEKEERFYASGDGQGILLNSK